MGALSASYGVRIMAHITAHITARITPAAPPAAPGAPGALALAVARQIQRHAFAIVKPASLSHSPLLRVLHTLHVLMWGRHYVTSAGIHGILKGARSGVP